jgi:CubicO group peptidase (beta-lactamase class C family)
MDLTGSLVFRLQQVIFKWRGKSLNKSRRRYLFLIIFSFVFATLVSCSNNESTNKQETKNVESETDNNEGNEQKENNEDVDSGNIDEEINPIPQTAVEIKTYWPTQEWKMTTPESVGMESSLLVEMFQHIEKEKIPMEGFLVIKDGYIVAEKYGGEYSQDTLHPIYSITKSLTSASVGLAIKQGDIKSVEDKALHYLKEEKLKNLNEWKKELTIKHFLTMMSGLDFPEQTQKGFYESDTWKDFMGGEDPAYFVMNRPVRENPDAWNYSTADARVVSKIIQEATGENLSAYAEQHLFKPLGIKNFEWPTDRSGTSFGGTGVKMSPRDIAKIGYLYLNNGRWDDQQLLPEDWVEESTQPYGDTNQNFDGDKYGYFFWLKPINGFETYRGMGLYGQYMVVVPDLDLVVVQTSSGMDVDPLLQEYIIPSIK